MLGLSLDDFLDEDFVPIGILPSPLPATAGKLFSYFKCSPIRWFLSFQFHTPGL